MEKVKLIFHVEGHIIFGGRDVSAYLPGIGIQQVLSDNGNSPVWKAR